MWFAEYNYETLQKPFIKKKDNVYENNGELMESS